MLRAMDGALAIGTANPRGGTRRLSAYAPPRAEFPPLTPAELRAAFGSGAPELEDRQRFLARAGRAREWRRSER